jgi:hypothetical protein
VEGGDSWLYGNAKRGKLAAYPNECAIFSPWINRVRRSLLQKVGGLHLNFFIVEQHPTFPPDLYEKKCPWDKKTMLEKWISERVLKLTCTAEDMRPLAEAAGFKEGVHKWDEAERAGLRAELDAAYFHLYGLEREEVDYVLDQFQGVVKEDVAAGRPGPTRRAILEAYDAMCGQ